MKLTTLKMKLKLYAVKTFVLLACLGWVLNVGKVFYADSAGEIVGRVLTTLIVPLGCISGYL